MDNAALVGVVVGFPVKVVGEFLPRPVSGGGNGGLALAAGYDFDTAMVDCYGLSSFLRVVPRPFVPRGTKRRLQDRTYHIHVVYKCALAGDRGQGAGDRGQGAGDRGQGAGGRGQGTGRKPVTLAPRPVFQLSLAAFFHGKRPCRSRGVKFPYISIFTVVLIIIGQHNKIYMIWQINVPTSRYTIFYK